MTRCCFTLEVRGAFDNTIWTVCVPLAANDVFKKAAEDIFFSLSEICGTLLNKNPLAELFVAQIIGIRSNRT